MKLTSSETDHYMIVNFHQQRTRIQEKGGRPKLFGAKTNMRWDCYQFPLKSIVWNIVLLAPNFLQILLLDYPLQQCFVKGYIEVHNFFEQAFIKLVCQASPKWDSNPLKAWWQSKLEGLAWVHFQPIEMVKSAAKQKTNNKNTSLLVLKQKEKFKLNDIFCPDVFL